MKRLFFIAAFFIFIAIFFVIKYTPQTFAQYNSQASYMAPQTDPDVPKNFRTYSHNAFLSMLSEVNCILVGSDPYTLSHECLGWDEKTGMIGYAKQNGGVVAIMTNLITLTYNFPVHTSSYIRYLSSNFHGFSDTSYAAPSIGATGLEPFLSLWVAFRNTAYLFVVIIFVVLGLLIMLRIKIDPRTVMTIQNQLPKIIIGLLLITFSYAIAGLLIDFMYVITYLFFGIVQNAMPSLNLDPATIVSYSSPFDAVDKIFPGGMFGVVGNAAPSLGDVIGGGIGNIPVIGLLINSLTSIIWIIPDIFCWIGNIINNGTCNTTFQAGTKSLATMIISIMLIVAVLTALFRFWIALVQTYLTIIFNIILGPVRILFGMVPSGPGGGFSGWFKDLIANLAVFPVSIAFIIMAAAIVTAVSNKPGVAFTPYLIPGTGIGGILALAAVLMLPKLPETVKEWFKVKGGGLGDSVGAGLAAGVGFVAGAGRKVGQSVKSTVFRTPDEYRHIQAGVGYKLFNPTNSWGSAKGWRKPFAAISGLGGKAIVRSQGMSVPGFENARKLAAAGKAQPYAPGSGH